MTVECSNCGDLGPAFWVTIGALLVAAAALIINAREHRVFMRRLSARARFDVSVETVGADSEGVFRTTGTGGTIRVSIGVQNTGEVAASETLVNVVFPRGTGVEWCGAQGEPVGDRRYPADTPGEALHKPDGRELTETQYLADTWDRIGLRPHYVKFVKFMVNVPDAGEAAVPLRVRVEADELPDDQPEYVIDHMVRVGPRRG